MYSSQITTPLYCILLNVMFCKCILYTVTYMQDIAKTCLIDSLYVHVVENVDFSLYPDVTHILVGDCPFWCRGRNIRWQLGECHTDALAPWVAMSWTSTVVTIWDKRVWMTFTSNEMLRIPVPFQCWGTIEIQIYMHIYSTQFRN